MRDIALIDFHAMTDCQLAAFIETHLDEFGDYEVTASEILKKAIFERFDHGFAAINNPGTPDVELWFIYVDPAYRGCGLGKQYVKAICERYAGDYFLSLHCHKRLRPFYGRLGFKVVGRDGDNRVMLGPNADALAVAYR